MLTFYIINCDEKKNFYGNKEVNKFSMTTLYDGTKTTKTLYSYKYMLAWKLATDDSFLRGYNSFKQGSRLNI